jgi:RNA polymerase sigma-70 factor (ECF subfamily)
MSATFLAPALHLPTGLRARLGGGAIVAAVPEFAPEEEQRLVMRAQAGDERAFEELVRAHVERLHAVVLRLVGDRHEAEEVVQESFLRAWRGIGSFRGGARFSTWLYRIGVNEATRRGARNATTFHADPRRRTGAREAADLSRAPEPSAEGHELQAALEVAILALAPEQRGPLVLRDVEGLGTTEAAAILGLEEAAFKSRLHRARRAVRKAVAPYLADGR